MVTTILEIRGRFWERESWNGRVALSERGETSEDGCSSGSKAEDPPGSKDLGVQGSDLRSINPQDGTKMFRDASRRNRGKMRIKGKINEDLEENIRFVSSTDGRVRTCLEAFLVNELSSSKMVHLSDGSFPCFNQ